MYANDIALFAPSAKCLQKLLDMRLNYGCSHDIQFNPLKSVVMYIDSRKLGAARSMMIGSDQVNFRITLILVIISVMTCLMNPI